MMKKYRVLGLMSGTSLDGLDIAYCELWKTENQTWDFKIEKAITKSYSDTWKSNLKNAILVSEKQHAELDKDYGKWLGVQAKNFIKEHHLVVDFIASHGHTSHHRPEEGYTFQLGNGQELANASNQQVVCDFRTLDVKLGGQGAPLVPIGDQLLFGEYDFCLNLGGISNISFKKDGQRLAYDIGLANMPLNYITQKIGLEFDEGGKIASSGQLNQQLFEALNSLAYYNLPFPKSTGYEWFSNKIVSIIDNSTSSTADLLHTFIHHNCHQIAKGIKQNSSETKSSLLVCGGGALNDFFMATLQKRLDGSAMLQIPNMQLINFKEALVFALMGILKIEKSNNILASVTGASQDSCSGEIFIPK